MTVREKKKKDQRMRLEHGRMQRKQALHRVLAAMGLLKEFQNLPGHLRARLIQSLPSIPQVGIEASARHRPQMQFLKKDLEQSLETEQIETDTGAIISLADYFTVCCVLPNSLVHLGRMGLSTEQRRVIKEAANKAAAIRHEWSASFMNKARAIVLITMQLITRIDEAVYGCIEDWQTPKPGKPVLRLTLVYSKPNEHRVDIDGMVRPAFQCPLQDFTSGIQWLELSGKDLGLDPERNYPVFIQSHALRRLKERFPEGQDVEGWGEFSLLESVRSPELVEKRGGVLLLAFRLFQFRLGYLVAQVVTDRIVITTFLFLTMRGTPEYRQLHQKLRLCRRDIEHLNLDRLETFLSPDLLRDQELVNVLMGCGCGSLLDLARDGIPCHIPKGRASELRKFLRIKAG